MNSARRALLYITRKKGKTLSLFLFLWIVTLFLLSCFSILHVSKSFSKDIRASLGASFYLRARTSVSFQENGEADITENNISISEQETEKIMRLGEIRYCNPVNYGFAKSDALSFLPGENHTEETNMGKVTALRYSALGADFLEETAVLTEGQHIAEGDSGKILISEQLARENQLSVGDSITLTHAKLIEKEGTYIDEIYPKTAFANVTISGIYQINAGKETAENPMTPTAGMPENQIYASLDVLTTLQESEAGLYTGEIGFYITDPADLSDITRKVQLLPEIDWQKHFIRTNDFQYAKIADQLSSLGDLMKILLLCASVASTAILTLMLTLRMHGRRQEAGILLSAGISKRQILGQFLFEILLVSLFAFLFSFASYIAISNLLEKHLFREIMIDLIGKEALITGILLYPCQTVVILISTYASTAISMRLNPRELLSTNE